MLPLFSLTVTISCSSAFSQNIYGSAQPSDTTPITPAFRDDRPILRSDPNPVPYTTQVQPNNADPSSTANPAMQPPMDKKPPLVQTEPESPSEITPTATADSLFHMTPGLRLSEQTDLSTPSSNQALGPLVAPDTGNGRMFEPGFRVGIFDVRPDISTSLVFDDNINASPNGSPNKKSDTIFNITPSLQVVYNSGQDGDTWAFNMAYAPTIQTLLSNGGENNVQQNFNLSADYKFSKLSLGFNQTFYTLTGGDPTSGTRVERTLSDSTVYAQYNVGEKTSVEVSTDLGTRSVNSAINYDTYNPNIKSYINYQYLPKLTLSIGMSAGLNFVESQATQKYLSPSVRALYDYSDKTKLFAEVGISYWDYGSSVSNTIDGNFQAGGTYELTPLVSLNFTGSRSQQVSNTIFGQNTIDTGGSVGATYKLLHQIGTSFNIGYENVAYIASLSGQGSGRKDNYFFLNPGITFSPLEYWDFSLSYSYRNNLSNDSLYRFSDNQVSISSTLRF